MNAIRDPWLAALMAAFLISATLLLFLRSQLGFFLDDWALVFHREGSPTDWLLPHNEHIIVLPAAIYKFSLAVFGMNAFPLHLVAVVLFLLSVLLLFLWLRPLVGDPASVLGCIVLLFLGSAAEDLLWAFQMGFFGSVCGGLGAMLLIRRGDLRSDAWACVLLVVSLLFSSMVIPFAVGAAVQILFRDGSQGWPTALRRSWVFIIPGLLYVIWWLGWGHLAPNGMSLHNAVGAPVYSLSAFAYSGAATTGLFPLHSIDSSNIWAVPGGLLAVFLCFVAYRRRLVPPELLVAVAAALTFWMLAGFNLVPGRGFHAGRYQYPDVIFFLMIFAGAFAGLRPGRWLITAFVLVAACSLLVNGKALVFSWKHDYQSYEQMNRATLTALELARNTEDPDFTVSVALTGIMPVDAHAYLIAVDKYGSPALSAEEIADASPENQTRLDQALVLALPVKLLPAAEVVPDLAYCRTVGADSDATATLPVDSRELWIRSRQNVLIRLGRFGPGAGALGYEVEAGIPTGYSIPADLSDRPWRIGFQGSGPVKVCPARPAG